jgi:putative Holliday junction resolvase
MARIIALDVGSKRIGVAISDELGILATPRGIIRHRSYALDFAEVAAIVQSNEAERVLVGHPISMGGNRTQQTRRVEQFAAKLAAHLAVPVELWDERLTTRAALEITGSDPEARRSGRRDAVAAAILLQAYLDGSTGAPSSG